MVPPTDRTGFHIAIICALAIESNAVDLLFDELYDETGSSYGKASGDTNKYKTGRVGKHHVVLLTLPSMGPLAALAGSAQMTISFPNIKFGLIVGVCGGLPQINGQDAFLGDVVISTSLLNYDFGRQYSDHFEVRSDTHNTLGAPSSELQSLLSFLQREHDMGRLKESTWRNLGQLQARAIDKKRKANYKPPSDNLDRIFHFDYEHIDRKEDCAECDATPRRFCELVTRKTCDDAGCEEEQQISRADARKRQHEAAGLPQIFLGKVACGNAVMKSGRLRDQKAKEHNVVAFEMEGAGAWKVLSCLVVKGICDYADSHKNKHWQNFAAATAASVAVAILEQYEPPDDTAGKSVASRQGPVSTVTHNYGGQSGNSRNILGATFGDGTMINMSTTYNNLPSVRDDGPHWLVPRSPSSHFTGRTSLLERIRKAIEPTENPLQQRRFVITGIGGEGKSEVCLRVADQVRELFWGVFWVDVSNSESALVGFRQVGDALGFGVSASLSKVLQGLARRKDDRWLLILDNADDKETDYQQYFPSGIYGSIILTSRLSNCSKHSTVGCSSLGALDKSECVALLLAVSGTRTSSAADQTSAEQIAERLGYHTLAVVQAGAYISEGYCSIGDYTATYDRQKERILNFEPDQAQPRYKSVFMTFEASARALESSRHAGASDSLELLWALSCLHFKEVPLDLFKDAIIGGNMAKYHTSNISQLSLQHVDLLPHSLQPAGNSVDLFQRLFVSLSHLRSLALITQNDTGGKRTISMHPLIHQWLRMRPYSQNTSQSRPGVVSIICFARLALNREGSLRGYWDSLGPHLSLVVDQDWWMADPYHPSQWEMQLLYGICTILEDLRSFKALDSIVLWILPILEARGILFAVENIPLIGVASHTLRRAGQTHRARDLLEKACLSLDSLPAYAINLLQLIKDLAQLYVDNHEHEQALILCSKGREMCWRVAQPVHESRQLDLHLQHMQGVAYTFSNPSMGLGILERVVQESIALLPQPSVTAMLAQRDIALAYSRSCNDRKAIESLKLALSRFPNSTIEGSHPFTLPLKGTLASLYMKSGLYGQAIDQMRQAVSGRAAASNSQDPYFSRCQLLLAAALIGNNEEGEGLARLHAVVQESVDELFNNPAMQLPWVSELHNLRGDQQYRDRTLQLVVAVIRTRSDRLQDGDRRLLTLQILEGQVVEWRMMILLFAHAPVW